LAERHETMMNPPIEELLERTGSKFRLVTVASMRARQINAYFGQLGDGLGSTVPPQVTSLARKPLSIAFEELDAGKIIGVDRLSEDELFDPLAEGATAPVEPDTDNPN
jgi:DNA-directed RNA polymerase subunit omega